MARPFPTLTSAWNRIFYPKARKGTYALAATLVMALLVGASALLNHQASRERRESNEWELRTHHVLDLTSRLKTATLLTTRYERTFLLTQDSSYLVPYRRARTEVYRVVSELAPLIEGQQQSGALSNIRGQLDGQIASMEKLISLTRRGRHEEVMAELGTGISRRSIDTILTELDEFERVERQQLAARAERSAVATRNSERLVDLLTAVSLILIAGGFISSLALRRALRSEAETREELRRMATTDELTGLANRREVLSGIDRMIAASHRHSRPLSIAILDIDRFKQVNDTHGHPAGDEVIRTISAMALTMMRKQDLVGRLGGEEFIIAMPDCDSRSAVLACERVREAVAALPIVLSHGATLKVTLSTGIAQLAHAEDRTRLIVRADEALYSAKNTGRDRVLLAA
ncbi:diguanylate cyclase [Altererythrobacter xixiisoli]|uniref:diguanylate cyclase n=1 Tax=Croceibacterium xixiisoli TaxID=1476466 RepID=A0A6I4TUD8_9SPHN|nr:diguanylate cyclase [Croceibacterium xixiisoli]MXO99825.1 diguanylate cyclase [Croceibacterium xixiisoli]